MSTNDNKPLDGQNILVAEDVELNAEMMRFILAEYGASSDIAANGEIAVKLFSDSTPGYYSAVLMDVSMPVMDGLTAARTIRELDRSDAESVPIIAMTANSGSEDIDISLKAGMNAHLAKPVDPSALFKLLTSGSDEK